MANRKDELLADVSFIFEECARLNQLVKEGKFSSLPVKTRFATYPTLPTIGRTGKCSAAVQDMTG